MFQLVHIQTILSLPDITSKFHTVSMFVADFVLQPSSLNDSGKARMQALTVVLQIALENSGGALKLKVAEVSGDRSAENLLTPLIIDILESEPMLSVSKQTS